MANALSTFLFKAVHTSFQLVKELTTSQEGLVAAEKSAGPLGAFWDILDRVILHGASKGNTFLWQTTEKPWRVSRTSQTESDASDWAAESTQRLTPYPQQTDTY